MACRKEIWDKALTTRRVGKEGRKDDSRGEKGGGRMKEMDLQDIKGGKEPQCSMLPSFTKSSVAALDKNERKEERDI